MSEPCLHHSRSGRLLLRLLTHPGFTVLHRQRETRLGRLQAGFTFTNPALRHISRTILQSVLICLLTGVWASVGKADWINLSGAENSRNIAEIHVERSHVKVKFEIYIQDLMLFEELIPDQLLAQPDGDRPGVEERMQRFSERTFQVVTGSGERLHARLDIVEPRMRIERPSPLAGKINPYTRQRIPGPPDDKRVLYAEVTYPFEGSPESLTFSPPVDESGVQLAAIGFTCYHQEVMVVDFRQLVPDSTLNLDWEDPWYSSFSKRQYQRRLQSGMRTYLYIEPYEVRHEILVRVKDMMTWIDFGLKGDEYIEEEEFDPVRQRIAEFFMTRESVLIDGERLKPILDRTAYVESSMLRSRFIEVPERIPLNTAMVGVIITYLTDGIPQQVETSWDLFSDRIQKVTANMIDPAGPFPHDLEPGDNVLKWTNYLKNYRIPTVEQIAVEVHHRGKRVPIISLVCLVLMVPVGYAAVSRRGTRMAKGLQVVALALLLAAAVLTYPVKPITIGSSARAAQINDEELANLVLGVLKNVYRAFDFREEEDVYDKLAISASGELLTDIYLQSRKSLQVEQAGGAQAKVKQIDILETAAAPSSKHKGGLDVRVKWAATGTVGHWGHIHVRRNVYDAILTLGVDDGMWKITDLEVLEEKRVDPFATDTVETSS